MKANLSTLRYIVAVDTYRNFVKAAEACGVTQPTLSIAIRNMEEELDVTIFNRNSHPVRPTPLGEKIITMARAALRSASQIEELVQSEKGEDGGYPRDAGFASESPDEGDGDADKHTHGKAPLG